MAEHGTTTRYRHGPCRCELCLAAKQDSRRTRVAAQRALIDVVLRRHVVGSDAELDAAIAAYLAADARLKAENRRA